MPSNRPGWATVPEAPGVVHVVPVDDLLDHEPTEDCVCGPKATLVQYPEEEDLPDTWTHTHHSLDGREART